MHSSVGSLIVMCIDITAKKERMHARLFITIRTVLCYLYKYIYTGKYMYTKLGAICIVGLQSILHNIFKYPTLGMCLCALQYYTNPLNHQLI